MICLTCKPCVTTVTMRRGMTMSDQMPIRHVEVPFVWTVLGSGYLTYRLPSGGYLASGNVKGRSVTDRLWYFQCLVGPNHNKVEAEGVSRLEAFVLFVKAFETIAEYPGHASDALALTRQLAFWMWDTK